MDWWVLLGWVCLAAAVEVSSVLMALLLVCAVLDLVVASMCVPHVQVNTSPFAGKEGKYVTSRNIKDRLDR